MKTKKEDKEYKEGMEYIMAKEKAEKKVLKEIRNLDLNFTCEICQELIKSWQDKLK